MTPVLLLRDQSDAALPTHIYLYVCQKANTPALIRWRVLVVLTRCYKACLHLHDNSLQRVVYCACAETKQLMMSYSLLMDSENYKYPAR